AIEQAGSGSLGRQSVFRLAGSNTGCPRGRSDVPLIRRVGITRQVHWTGPGVIAWTRNATRVPDQNESVDAELRRGLDEHQRGRLTEAEQAYANVLSRQPDHAHALHLLGIIALTTGRLDRAVMLIGKA